MGLYISVTTASSELKDCPISRDITRLAAAVTSLGRQGQVPDTPSLDITFMLPGKLDKPAFTGMQMGGYTLHEQTLYFQVAVPERVLDAQLSGPYLELVLEDVVANAAELFQQHRIPFDEAAWRRLVALLGSKPPARPDLKLVETP